MTALHLVSQPDALASCLEVADEDDEIFLLGAAALLSGLTQKRPVVVLADDLPTDCVLAPGVSTTDYSGFVELVARHKPIVSWR